VYITDEAINRYAETSEFIHEFYDNCDGAKLAYLAYAMFVDKKLIDPKSLSKEESLLTLFTFANPNVLARVNRKFPNNANLQIQFLKPLFDEAVKEFGVGSNARSYVSMIANI